MNPFVRDAGTGPGVICLHANASTSAQWRGLAELLAPRFRVLAPDGIGAGRSPAWPGPGEMRLADEVAFLEPVLAAAGERFHLIGHSYGGGVATKMALAMPQRVASLVLFEPTLFALLRQEQPDHPAAAGIDDAAHRAAEAVDRGDLDGAAQRFIDFWMGAGSWAATPAARRAPVAASMAPVRRWVQAINAETYTLADVAALRMPVLLLHGADSPPPGQAVTQLLAATLAQAQTVRLEGVGHMGPVTHPDVVNAQIAAFLAAQRP
jgi:pimeloyl-ACP methyl ester carboxylesterase